MVGNLILTASTGNDERLQAKKTSKDGSKSLFQVRPKDSIVRMHPLSLRVTNDGLLEC